jgi:hypothetical protein
MATTHNGNGGGPPADGHPSSGTGSPLAAAFDPYYLYAKATNFRFVRHGEGDPVPVLLELRLPLARLLDDEGPFLIEVASYMVISPLYTQAPAPLRATFFVTALVWPGFFIALERGALTKWVRRFDYCAPLQAKKGSPKELADAMREWAQTCWAPTKYKPDESPASAVPVMVGVIDDAIGFAHERFRAKGGTTTRVAAFWSQGDAPPGVGTPGPSPSDGFILDRVAIDALLAAATHAGIVDDDQVYAAAGNTFVGDAHKNRGRRIGHGTHVMDIAAGEKPADVTAGSPILAAVELPIPVTADSSGVLLTSYALDGLWWILSRTHALGQAKGVFALPCVVNLSYGTLSGPHDGTDLLPRAVDFAIEVWRDLLHQKLSVVLPAGNGYVSETHVVVTPRISARPEPLTWRILPDTRTPSFLEIWLPHDTLDGEIQVQVTPPGAMASGWIKEDYVYPWPSPALPLLRVSFLPTPPDLGRRKLILLGVFPTAPQTIGSEIAPAGDWLVELRNVHACAERTIDAWIRRNDSPVGYPIRGRQSRFADRGYTEERYGKDGRLQETDNVAWPIRRLGTLNGLATGALPVVVGSCRWGNLSSAPYSAAGPTLKPSGAKPAPRTGPDVLAPGEMSYARAGVLAAGMNGAMAVTMGGTSVAAPQITRLIATAMSTGSQGSRAEVGTIATNEENTRDPTKWPSGPLYGKPDPARADKGRIVIKDLPPANRLRWKPVA